jgi:hypothetical protein
MQVNFGSGSGAYYFSKDIGIVAEFEGYGSYTHNFTVPPPYCIGNTCAANVHAFTHGDNNQSNFRYQAGIQFRF